MYAIADGPHADPADADRMRNAIIVGALHASAVSAAKTPAASKPVTNTRLWPHRSPALPKAGPTTPNASIGPVIAQLSTLTDESNSSAMRCSDTTRIVTVKLTVNRPPSTTHSTAHRRSIPMRAASRRRSRIGHGTTPSSSTPAGSNDKVRSGRRCTDSASRPWCPRSGEADDAARSSAGVSGAIGWGSGGTPTGQLRASGNIASASSDTVQRESRSTP